MVAEIVFWACAGTIIFTYAGYPLVLGLLALVKGRPPAPVEPTEWPFVSALVVAYNEERQIENKIRNILENGYPADRIEVVVCSDGSTDQTNERVKAYGDPRVRLAASPVNLGVNAAFARGAAEAKGDVFLMTDSGSLFDQGAIQKVARHFADPKVGLVSGRILFENPLKSSIGSGYRAYWLVETGVRELESRLGIGAVTVGAFEMIRRTAYLPVPSHLSNDISAPMYTHHLGFLCRYEPQGVTVAQQRKTAGQDFARRLRMAVRTWSTIPYLLGMVPFLQNIGTWLALLCHKYLRFITWLFSLGMLVANLFLLDGSFYRATLAAQGLACVITLIGWILTVVNLRVRPLTIPFYFCLLQAAAMVGLLQALAGRRIQTWKPAD